MDDKSFGIYLQHRPRRVAFLVDLGQDTVDKILSAILRFNLESWGGRHNPIVPLVNKRISEACFTWLDVADPDIFYIYGEIDGETLEAVHSRYAPTFIAQHVVRQPEDWYSYGVHLRGQATVRKYLSNIQDKTPPYDPRSNPCLLQLEIREEDLLSPFVLWNFGYTRANYFAIQNHGVPGCRPKSTSDHDLVELFTTQRNLAWPIHVCGDAPITRTAGDSWRYDFPIFCGDSPWNLVAYWNDALTTGRTSAVSGGINQLWLPPKVLAEDRTYRQLVLLLQRRVYSGGNHQKRLRVISYDMPEAELEEAGRRILADIRGPLSYGGCVKLDAPQVSSVEARTVVSLFPRVHVEVEYVSGKDVHLQLRRPPEIADGDDESWMVDARIDNPGQELWYTNGTPWWRLPRKPAVAGLFVHARPQRIICDRRVSFEVSAHETMLDVEVPSKAKLFRYLLSPQIHYHLAADARSALRGVGDSPHEIRLSDKGRYLSGIQDLFGSIREMLHIFEHPFWRSLLQKLSEKEPSDQLVKKLASDAQKLLKNAWAMEEAELSSWLTQQIIFASKSLSRAPVWLTYQTIQKQHDLYIEGLQEEEKRAYRSNLKSDLSELTRNSVIFQGANLRCPNCISSYWYSVEEIKKTVPCRGCHVPFSLPAETEWSYQLNELVRAGVGDHGLLPVLRTLARLFDNARDCFFFSPSVEFLNYPDQGAPKAERELDLAWVKDGLFGIAEVKETTKLFKQSDYEDLTTLARRVKPDVVLIAAPAGNDEDMAKGKSAIQEKLTDSVDVWAWGPAEFKKSPWWIRG